LVLRLPKGLSAKTIEFLRVSASGLELAGFVHKKLSMKT
jgi:hypothetical protein